MSTQHFWSDLAETDLLGEELEQFAVRAQTLADILKPREESMFRRPHDVVLLTLGFRYGFSGDTMHKVQGGNTWVVDLTTALPVWYCDGVRIGGMTYDDVVNQFSEKRAA